MTFPKRALMILTAVAALSVGVGVAYAATSSDNSDLKRAAEHLTAKAEAEASVAKKLGTTAEKLEAAYVSAAKSRIDAALAAGDITAAQASTLTAAVEDGRMAHRLADPADVAKELGVTEQQLENAYTEARKAEMKARVDQALEDGKITKAYADELKQQIDEADLSGFGPGGPGRHGDFGGRHGHGGPGGGFGLGPGFGPGFGGPDGDSDAGSGTTTPAAYF